MARYPPTGSRVSLSASTRVRGIYWTGATTIVSSWQRRSWKYWRGLWTDGANKRFPVWLHPRQRHNRCNLCCQAAAREVSSYQKETLHNFHRPGEGIWSWAIWWVLRKQCWGVDCVTRPGDVCQCTDPCRCWWGV